MFHRDYIQRLLEQMAQGLARALGLKRAEKYDEARAEIEDLARRLLGLDLNLVLGLPDEAVLEWLRAGGTLDSGKCYVLASLLAEEAEVQERQGLRESQAIHAKALRFAMEALLENRDLRTEHRLSTVPALVQKLDASELPEALRAKLFHYYETVGDYARAEDTLFQWIELGSPRVFRMGLDFYRRLLSKSDAELEKGNLPREEVEEGLTALGRRTDR